MLKQVDQITEMTDQEKPDGTVPDTLVSGIGVEIIHDKSKDGIKAQTTKPASHPPLSLTNWSNA